MRQAMNPMQITRREFMRTAGAVSAGLALTTCRALPSEAAESKEKTARCPNILFAIADDWSWPHAGAYGDRVVKTPAFDRVAAEGMLFSHAFCTAPTCTASRGAILTGQAPHRLEEGANLWSILQSKFPVYPDLLEAAGYVVGQAGKGWAPGSLEGSGRTRNPAGPGFKGFGEFLQDLPPDRPFCFWFGSHFPHRAYEEGSGAKSGMKIEDVDVPPFLPDKPAVRSDFLDYYHEVQQFDAEVGDLLRLLNKSGRAENTLVVVTSDNGMPFPRGKTNLYDSGTRMPLAIRWPGRVKPGRKTDALISFTDFAPTFLEAAGLEPHPDMTGRSFVGLLAGRKSKINDAVFTERERHAYSREGNLSYPARAVRMKDFLYIRNLRPDRGPAGDDKALSDLGLFGDIDRSPSKSLVVEHRDDLDIAKFFNLTCARRPAEELFDVRKDPWQIENVAGRPEYASIKRRLRGILDRWLKDTADPRALDPSDDRWDRYPYVGRQPK
jgi:arylsulfatase A-like enzyme